MKDNAVAHLAHKAICLSEADIRKARKLYEEDGLNLYEVGDRLNLPDGAIRKAFAANGIRLRGVAFTNMKAALASKMIVAQNGCWEWTGYIQDNGYGRMTFQRKSDTAHRWAVRATGVEIPKGVDVCHTCDNRRCINPNHLFLGTRLENMLDCKSKGRIAFGSMLPSKKGEDGPGAKLTWDEVRTIRAVKPRGKAVFDVAAQFKVSPDNIRVILRGETWKE